MTNKNGARVVPYHMESLKNLSLLYYTQELEEYNSLMDAVCDDDVRDTDILWLSRDHLRLVYGAYFSAKNPQRAFLHLQQYQYFGVKGIERKLLRGDENIAVQVHGDTLSLGALVEDNRFFSGPDLLNYFWSSILLNKTNDAQYLADVSRHDKADWFNKEMAVYSDILAGFFHYKAIDVKAEIELFVAITDIDIISTDLYDFVAHIALPTISVMLKVFGAASEEEYREAIYAATQAHYEFWSQERLEGLTTGDLSLPLMALAKIAYRKYGYTLGFITDYIPEYIYQMSPELEAASPINFEPIPLL